MKNVAVFRAVRHDETEPRRAMFLEHTEELCETIQHYFRFYFGNTWTVKGFLFPYEGDHGILRDPYNKRFNFTDPLNEYIASGACGNFVPTATHVIGGRAEYCGMAVQGKGISAKYIYGTTCSVKVDIHEMFHADTDFALGHSGKVDAEGREHEYGFGMMGAITDRVQGINAPHMRHMGLLDGPTIRESCTVKLAPCEVPDVCLKPDENRIIVVKRDRKPTYTISTRMTRGHRFALPAATAGTVYVHRLDKLNKTKRMLPDLKIGQSRIIDGITVENIRAVSDISEVRITL